MSNYYRAENEDFGSNTESEQCKHLMNPETCISCEDEMNTEKREKDLIKEQGGGIMKEEATRRNASYNRVKEKRWFADVEIQWGCSFEAKNREEAIEFLKEQYKDDYGIDLNDSEIIKLEEEE